MMNRRSRNALTGGMIAVIVSSMLLLQGCMDHAVGSQPEEEKVDPAIPVEDAEVSSGDVAAFYSGTATLEADEQAVVVTQITGVVLEILVEEGDYVESG